MHPEKSTRVATWWIPQICHRRGMLKKRWRDGLRFSKRLPTQREERAVWKEIGETFTRQWNRSGQKIVINELCLKNLPDGITNHNLPYTLM